MTMNIEFFFVKVCVFHVWLAGLNKQNIDEWIFNELNVFEHFRHFSFITFFYDSYCYKH